MEPTKEGEVTLENFMKRFQKKYDEKLPTVILPGATYATNLFQTSILRGMKVAKIF